MNKTIRKIFSIPGVIKSSAESHAAKQMIEMIEKYSEKYVTSGISQRGIVTAKISISMRAKSIKIDREKFANIQNILNGEENANEVLATLLEEEIMSALENAMAKLMSASNKSLDSLKKESEVIKFPDMNK